MVRAVRMSQGLDHYWPHCSRGVSAIDDGRNPDPIALLQEARFPSLSKVCFALSLLVCDALLPAMLVCDALLPAMLVCDALLPANFVIHDLTE